MNLGPRAEEEQSDNGWMIAPKYLRTVAEVVNDREPDMGVSEEQVEAVLLAVELDYAKAQTEETLTVDQVCRIIRVAGGATNDFCTEPLVFGGNEFNTQFINCKAK